MFMVFDASSENRNLADSLIFSLASCRNRKEDRETFNACLFASSRALKPVASSLRRFGVPALGCGKCCI